MNKHIFIALSVFSIITSPVVYAENQNNKSKCNDEPRGFLAITFSDPTTQPSSREEAIVKSLLSRYVSFLECYVIVPDELHSIIKYSKENRSFELHEDLFKLFKILISSLEAKISGTKVEHEKAQFVSSHFAMCSMALKWIDACIIEEEKYWREWRGFVSIRQTQVWEEFKRELIASSENENLP